MSTDIGHYETVHIDQIKPYWRNPRRITDEAINALAESIRTYGYQQPIVVDAEHVIIAGHTRYSAMRRLGVERLPVLVATALSHEQAKQYRLIDNRSGEFSSWDYEALTAELGSLGAEGSDLLAAMFPELSGGDQALGAAVDAQVAAEWEKVNRQVSFVCPACFHAWEMEVTKDALQSGVLSVAQHEEETSDV